MSERWWRRRRRSHPWFGDFCDEANEIEKIADNMIREALGSPAGERPRRKHARRSDVFQPTLGDCPEIGQKYEPLLDVFADETCVVIVAELTGVDKDSIAINALEDKVTISVDSPKLSYHREISLPDRVNPNASTASYKNGVLQVRLKKQDAQELLIK